MWTGIYVFWTPFLFLCPVKHGTRGAEWRAVSRPIRILVQFWLFCWVDPPLTGGLWPKQKCSLTTVGGEGWGEHWTCCQLADRMKPGVRSNLRMLCNLRTWINVFEVFDLHLTKPNLWSRCSKFMNITYPALSFAGTSTDISLKSVTKPNSHEYHISRLLSSATFNVLDLREDKDNSRGNIEHPQRAILETCDPYNRNSFDVSWNQLLPG